MRQREREREYSKFDVIYIDPPYNTEAAKGDGNSVANDKENIANNKFIYRDKFSRNGWLNMMNERLLMAKKLLREDGVIFVSIDDSEQAYLKVLMDEIFGEENFIANIAWIKKRGPGGNTSQVAKIVKNCEYILVYGKNFSKSNLNYKIHDNKKLKQLGYVNKDEFFDERGYYKLTDLYHPSSTGSFQYIESLDYPIEAPDGSLFKLHVNIEKPKSGRYTWSKEAFDVGNKLGFILIKKNPKGFWQAYRKQYQFVKFNPKSKEIVRMNAGQEYESYIEDNIYSQEGGYDMKNILSDKNIFDFPKPITLIKYLLKIKVTKNSRILDFFAGSGTTAQAVMELNREDGGNRTYTIVTNNENNIAYDVTYERLYRINKGIGTKGETFKWTEKNKPFKNNLNVYKTEYYDTEIDENSDSLINQKLKQNLKEEMNNFGINNFNNDSKEILTKLLSLKPQEKLN